MVLFWEFTRTNQNRYKFNPRIGIHLTANYSPALPPMPGPEPNKAGTKNKPALQSCPEFLLLDADTLDKAGALDPISINNRCRNTVCPDLAASSSRNNNQETSYGTPGARRDADHSSAALPGGEKQAGSRAGLLRLGLSPWGDPLDSAL